MMRGLKVKDRYKVISIHSRKQHNLEQALALYHLYGKDFSHVTSFYFGQGAVRRMKMISKKLAAFMAKRSIEGLPKANVVSIPRTEIKRQLAPKLKYYYSPYMQDRVFQKQVIKKIAAPEICISFDGQSHQIFKAWKGKSKLVLDLTVA